MQATLAEISALSASHTCWLGAFAGGKNLFLLCDPRLAEDPHFHCSQQGDLAVSASLACVIGDKKQGNRVCSAEEHPMRNADVKDSVSAAEPVDNCTCHFGETRLSLLSSLLTRKLSIEQCGSLKESGLSRLCI